GRLSAAAAAAAGGARRPADLGYPERFVGGAVVGELDMIRLDAPDLLITGVGLAGRRVGEVGEVGPVRMDGHAVEVAVQIGNRLIERVDPPDPRAVDEG